MTIYFRVDIEPNLSLALTELNHAKDIFELLDTDRENIGQFLDFVPATKIEGDELNYIKKKIHGVAQETDSLFSIVKNEQIVGVIDLHFIDMKNKKAEIGYWLHSKYQHQGIMTKAVRKVCEYAFDNLGLNKLSIFADVKNIGSNLVAKHAEFSFVTIHKEYYFHEEQFCDMNEYSLLKRHFRKWGGQYIIMKH